jgi:hypothetical protein
MEIATAGAARPLRAIRAFSKGLLVIWMTVAVVTVTLEIIPARFHPLMFYSYKTIKVLLFLALGYLTPLAFWRFDRLTLGLCFAGASATAIELLQGIIGNGHAFSWMELLAKLALIGFGFVLALDARYERAILIGPLHFRLVSDHLPGLD